MSAQLMKLCNIGRLLSVPYFVVGFIAAMTILYQFWEFPSGRYYLSELWPENLRSANPVLNSTLSLGKGVEFNVSKLGIDGAPFQERSGIDVDFGKNFSMIRNVSSMENGAEQFYIKLNSTTEDNDQKHHLSSLEAEYNNTVTVSANNLTVASSTSMDRIGALSIRSNTSASISNLQKNTPKQVVELQGSFNKNSFDIEKYLRRMRRVKLVTLSKMKSMLLSSPKYSNSVRQEWSAVRDNELLSASSQIKNAPVLRSVTDLHAPVFRNVSVFKRSYDLMDQVLKIYVYKEGTTPIFHQPGLTGIYAGEGWFMELIEKSKHFTVEDPKKAHLYYLPFSSTTLRWTLYDEKSHNVKNLEDYLKDYVDLIKNKYIYWNATGGADHFFVACHDWALRITRKHMSSCIRALCNANVARGFSIGKDVSVPVTFIHNEDDPSRDTGGKPPSERDVLAFFAGKMHGYLRPLLLMYWENKVSDMKIFGPMLHNTGGKTYEDYMKSSKYCICARGYQVHSPRVVESILHGCIPVIIADNYMPPFFEVLDWETFAVFIPEKDIPNLRSILLTISEDRYLDMHHRLKMVQRHFIWHKTPQKYDIFHMILHSLWSSRVSRIRPL